jgi:hypothetical protein
MGPDLLAQIQWCGLGRKGMTSIKSHKQVEGTYMEK